ncbi:MAG: glycosyltransferase family 9 protein [Crocinitomicaceae bacterium]
MNLDGKRVIISRTDSIGDVMLTLPMCAYLKEKFPTAEILFLGKGYTRAIVEAYSKVDEFIDWNDYVNQPKLEGAQNFRALNADVIIHVFPNKEIASLAKKVRVGMRIGTSHRSYHLLTCTHRINFTRKKSDLHEAQLNFELLRPFGSKERPTLEHVIESTSFLTVPKVELPAEFAGLEDYSILHPKSQGSAKEWPIEKYISLTNELVEQGKTVVFTGTEAEGKHFRDQITFNDKVIDTTGKLTLEQLMVLIHGAKNLVACSTGPLHIAGFYGVTTIGLFSPKRPIHPGRWKALGTRAIALVFDPKCELCAKRKPCNCIESITVESVLEKINFVAATR